MLTVNQQRVQFYMTYSGEKPSKSLKTKRIERLEDELLKHNLFASELFPVKQFKVLEQILFYLSATGICKIKSTTLADKLDVSVRTVSNAVKSMKNTNQFIVARLQSSKTNNGCYVFVDKLHENFKEIMKDVFLLNSEQVASQFAYQDKAENVDVSSLKRHIPTSNLELNSFNKQASNSYTSVVRKQIELELTKTKTIDEQREYLSIYVTNPYQNTLFEFIVSMPFADTFIQHASILALRIGSDADITRFTIAKDVLLSMNLSNSLFESVAATFSELLKQSIIKHEKKPRVSSEQLQGAGKNVPIFYNWLEERE